MLVEIVWQAVGILHSIVQQCDDISDVTDNLCV